MASIPKPSLDAWLSPGKLQQGAAYFVQKYPLDGELSFMGKLFLFGDALTCSFSNFFFLFRATPAAYGSFQARGRTGAVVASLYHSQGNSGSELHLQPTLQLAAMLDS